ncbi:MAG: helix-turn-helix transcriptional regulator [Clostridia bacterium]|nr:helix-turn-helix transcriptional regulator [Clostridia bacterium]
MDTIKELRVENNLTQKELADKIGVTNKSIWAYETGYAIPPIETLIKLADVFNCSLDYLVGRENELGYILTDNSESTLTEDEKFLLYAYRKLEDKDKKVLNKLLIALIERD